MTTRIVPASSAAHEIEPADGWLGGLDLARVLAVVLVLYTQLASWFRAYDQPLAGSIVDDFLVYPLRINADFRFFGAALIFLISGFLAARVADYQYAGEYTVKRVLRVFPALWAGVLLAWGLVAFGLQAVPGTTEARGGDLVDGLLLANFFSDSSAVTLVGAAWALLPILAVYLMTGLLLPVFRRTPWLAVACQITACSVLLSIAQNFDNAAGEAAGMIAAFAAAVLIGQVIWLVWSGSVPLWAGGLLGVGCWVIFVWGDYLGYGRAGGDGSMGYPLTLGYAVLIMIAAVQISDRVPHLPWVSYVVSRSLPILVVHQAVTAAVLSGIAAHVWSGLAVLAALGVTLLAAELVYRVAEVPAGWLVGYLGDRYSRDGVW